MVERAGDGLDVGHSSWAECGGEKLGLHGHPSDQHVPKLDRNYTYGALRTRVGGFGTRLQGGRGTGSRPVEQTAASPGSSTPSTPPAQQCSRSSIACPGLLSAAKPGPTQHGSPLPSPASPAHARDKMCRLCGAGARVLACPGNVELTREPGPPGHPRTATLMIDPLACLRRPSAEYMNRRDPAAAAPVPVASPSLQHTHTHHCPVTQS